MDELKGNSHIAKENAKNIEKVADGTVKKKNGAFSKFIESDLKDVREYLVNDVIIPSIKKGISDIITNACDMIFGQKTGNRRDLPAERVSYRSYYQQPQRIIASSAYDYDTIVYKTRGEAEEVLMRMREIVNEFDRASVADLNDLSGVSGNYTDNNYGWGREIAQGQVIRVSGGYMIDLPNPRYLK